jgi:hypothetical protein
MMCELDPHYAIYAFSLSPPASAYESLCLLYEILMAISIYWLEAATILQWEVAGGKRREEDDDPYRTPEADDIEIQRARIWAHTFLFLIYRNSERSVFSRPGIHRPRCRRAASLERATESRR